VATIEGLDTAARKAKRSGRLPVITDDMLHTVLQRRAGGESVEQSQRDLVIPTGKRKGQDPSVASTYRALAGHGKREASRRGRARRIHCPPRQRSDRIPERGQACRGFRCELPRFS